MRPPQLRMKTLLKDPTYRKFFATAPRLYETQQIPGTKPWWLYVQRKEDGPWGRRATETYRDAFDLAKKALKKLDVHDLTIVSRRASYRPPRGFEWPQSHRWCPYCRRPTVFWYFRRHHALTRFKDYDLSEVPRCTVCGIPDDDMIVWTHQSYELGKIRS